MTGEIFLEASELSVREPDGTVFVPIVRTGDLSGPVTIEYGVSADTATEGVDYIDTDGFVTMAAGEDRVLVPVQILDDGDSELTETFVLAIINVDSGTLLFPRTARVDILDDENPVADPPNPPLVSDFDVSEVAFTSALNQPIAFEFAPQDSSLVYIAEKNGTIKLFDTDTNSFLPDFLDLTGAVNNVQDRGLMDMELHPNFPADPYIYVFYVVDPPQVQGESGNDGPDGGGNRYSHVVRFTADAATNYQSVVAGSEVILVGGAGESLADISGAGAIDSTSPSNVNVRPSDIDPVTGELIDDYLAVDSRSHAGGALSFGPDGALYISTGDGTSFNFADPRSALVQDIDSLRGKILRVDPLTGEGLADNPFVEPGDDLSANASKVYQLGLRNPFSMAFDADGNLLITDTGWNFYEEINSGGPGANFGWPYYEGADNGILNQTIGYRDLPEAADFYAAVAAGDIEITTAVRAFSHASSSPGFQVQAITGADSIITDGPYPDELNNHYIFTDFSQGEIFAINLNDQRDVKFLYEAPSGFAPVHFKQGPDGFTYYANIVTGEFGRLDIIDPDPGPDPDPSVGLVAALAAEDMTLTDLDSDGLSWNVVPVAGAIGASVLKASSDRGEEARAQVTFDDAGTYTLYAKVRGFDNASNSVFAQAVLGAPADQAVHFGTSGAFQWIEVATYTVGAGDVGTPQSIAVGLRENRAEVDELVLHTRAGLTAGELDALAIAGNPGPDPDPDPPQDLVAAISAESMTLTDTDNDGETWNVVQVAGAVGGSVLKASSDRGEEARAQVTFDEAGTYTLYAKLRGFDNASNSIFTQNALGAPADQVFHFDGSGAFQWVQIATYAVGAGELGTAQTIAVGLRERRAEVDELVLHGRADLTDAELDAIAGAPDPVPDPPQGLVAALAAEAMTLTDTNNDGESWDVVQDAGAVGGAVLKASRDRGEEARAQVTFDEAGTYTLYAKLRGFDNASNSIFAQSALGAAADQVIHFDGSGAFQWVQVATYAVAAGDLGVAQTIAVGLRENRAEVDELVLHGRADLSDAELDAIADARAQGATGGSGSEGSNNADPTGGSGSEEGETSDPSAETARLVEDIAGEIQHETGTAGTDIFVIDGNSSDYAWSATEDGQDHVVWRGAEFNVLYDFEKIRFADQDITLSQAQGAPGEVRLIENIVGQTQYETGTDARDVFVISGPASDYGWAPTDDGAGHVVWSGEEFDIVYEFEELRFDDETVDL